MVMFNSYVKLPEGRLVVDSGCSRTFAVPIWKYLEMRSSIWMNLDGPLVELGTSKS